MALAIGGGPLLLHVIAGNVAADNLAAALSQRLGAKVEVASIRPAGITGVLAQGVRITHRHDRRARIAIDRLSARFAGLRPSLSAVSASGVRVTWRRPGAFRELARLARRLRRGAGGPRNATRARGGRRLALRLAIEGIDIRDGDAARWRRIRVGTAVVRRTARGDWAARVRGLAAASHHGVVLAATVVRWRGGERDGRLTTRGAQVEHGTLRLGPRGARETRFTVTSREIAPELLQLQIVAAPQPVAHHAAAARASHMVVRASLDWRKGRHRAEAKVRDYPLGLAAAWFAPYGLHLGDSVVRGRFRLTHSRAGTITFRPALTTKNLRVSHTLLAPRPVRWPPIRLTGEVRWNRRKQQLELVDGDLHLRDVALRVRSTLRLAGGGLRARLDVELPRTSCAKLQAALPGDLLGPLKGWRVAGSIYGRLALGLDTRRLERLEVEGRIDPSRCSVLYEPPEIAMNRLRRPFSFITRPPGASPRRLIMGRANPNWRSFADLGRTVIGAFIAAEDQRFFEHNGFDRDSIRRALILNVERRTLLKGASSISQQVVKNVFLSHRRTLARKLQEAMLTWRLEQVVSKRRIMELYLNLIELGPDVFGIPQASRLYFRRDPFFLTPMQAAHLALITPSPKRAYARFGHGQIPAAWRERLRRIVYRMYFFGYLDRESYERSRRQPLKLRRYQQVAVRD